MQPRFRWFFLSLLLTASLPVRAAAEPPDEALRQLSLTDEELARGRWERAVHHARSALTLDPEGGQAWLLLGLAEAGRGQQAPAEKALLSYLDWTGHDDDGEALALDGLGKARGVPLAAWDSVRSRLRAGDCARAVAEAAALTERLPEATSGWLLLGDAWRCIGETRRALEAYRRAGDEAVELVRTLRSELGTLVVRLTGLTDDVVADLVVHVDGERIAPIRLGSDRYRFEDLPAERTVEIRIRGVGVAAGVKRLDGVGPGEERRLRLRPRLTGVATLAVADFEPAKVELAVVAAEGPRPLRPGEDLRVSAGAVALQLTGPQGRVDLEIDAEPGERIDLDPGRLAPATLTLAGLPDGAHAEVSVQADFGVRANQKLTLQAADDAPIEDGVRTALPRLVGPLPGGAARVDVSHPVLGDRSWTVMIRPGEVNARELSWRQLPRASLVEDSYDVWLGGRVQEIARGRRQTGGVAAAFVSMLCVSGASFVASGQALDQADGRFVQAEASTTGAAAREELAHQSGLWQTAHSALFGIGAAAGGIAIPLGLGTVGSAARDSKRRRALAAWQPADVVAGSAVADAEQP